MITTGELQPGAPVSEVRLAEQFGVSRTPVREALKELQVEGLVEIRAQVGTFVSQPSLEYVEEMSIVGGVLEAMAARLMAQRSVEDVLDQMEQNLCASEDAAARNDVIKYAELVPEFHGLVLRGSGNNTLVRFNQLLANQIAYPNLVRGSLNQPGRAEKSVAEHRKIYEAIRAGDPQAAEEAMRLHVEISHQHTMRALRATRSGESDPTVGS